MKRTPILFLFVLLCAPLVRGHEGEDHGDQKKPVAGGAAARKAERTVNTADGQFKFLLTQTPADPRDGEEVQFEVRFVEMVEGGFEGGQAPIEDAKVAGQVKTASGNQVSSPIEAHKEKEAGVYGIHYTFKSNGDFKLIVDAVTGDGRKVTGDFPVAVVAAPIRYTPYLIDLLLLVAGVAFIGVRYRAADRSSSRETAVRHTLPPAAVTVLIFAVSVALVHYVMPATEPRAAAAAPVAVADPNTVFIPKESQLLFGIRTQEVKQEKIVGGVTVTGVVKVQPQSKAEVVPPVSGRTRAAGNFTVGSYVRAGQTLAIVEQVLSAPEAAGLEATRTDLRAKTAALQAQANQALTRRNLAQIELNRAKKLYDAGAAALKRVQEAETQLKLAEQELDAAQKGAKIMQLGEQRVDPIRTFPLVAPVSGVISQSNFTPGEQVEAGKSLFTIMNLDRLWIEAQVFEKDLATVTSAKRAAFKLAAFPNEVFQIGDNSQSRLITVGAAVDPEKRTVPVVYEVQNPGGRLRDGMFAEITIDTTGDREVISVPKAAVIEEQGKKLVYIYDGGERFEKRTITVGSEGQTAVEVLSGLKPGERVVVEGIYQLRSTAPGGTS